MSHGKQITLFSHKTATNGWKVALILEELGLSYEPIYLTLEDKDIKSPEYTKYNPNGRTPALIDHANNDFVIWESDAIIQYIVNKYDTERKISFAPGTDEYHAQLQWLFFQASGQGPYFGQAFWFLHYHPENIPSVIERYRNEARRVLGVLEGVLSKQEWLVGNKPTIADISFIMWNNVAETDFLDNFDFFKEFPATAKWHYRLLDRPAIKKAWAVRQKLIEAEAK